MSDPFLGEIRMLAGNQVPTGWAECNGQLLPIHKWQALYSLLGTSYGGNGQNQFALPDFRGLSPVGQGQGDGLASYVCGQKGGSHAVTLLENQLPTHGHAMQVSNNDADLNGNGGMPTGQLPARGAYDDGASSGAVAFYSTDLTALEPMNPEQALSSGDGEPHDNMSPYLTVMFIIALQGTFPVRP